MVGAVIITWVTTGSVMLAKTEELVFERCIAGERKKMKKGKKKCTRTPILSLSRTHRKREKERKRERERKKRKSCWELQEVCDLVCCLVLPKALLVAQQWNCFCGYRLAINARAHHKHGRYSYL